jgi:acetylornithine deacetylase/succinyl-diaminopimelate desuccinylase-like protein
LHLACALVLAACVRPTSAGQTDWRRLGDETADLLGNIVRIDTTNPPGGETAAANALARALQAEGIQAQVVESAPGRGNLHARLRGRGSGRPIILLSHLDVVPADGRGWRVPPFSGKRDGGWVWGRGTIDAKGVAAIQTMALIALARSGQPPPRDVILLATADEETGGRAGAGWLVEHRPDLLGGAEFLMTEGDHIHVRDRHRRVAQVAIGEKTPCWLKLTARGNTGHGSTPPPQTAVTRLVRAINKLRRLQTPIRVVPSVETYFGALGALEPEPLRSHLKHLARSLEDPTFLTEFTRNPRQNALVRNTITPTVLSAGTKTNVIPPEATAQLDCRLLPGEKPADFLSLLRDVIADDAIEIETILSFAASASPADSAFMTAVRKLVAAEFSDVPVVPSVIPGFTDSHYFREHGIASYGFVPFVLTEEDEKSVHGVNERVSVENLREGVRRLVALLRAL